MADLRVSEYVPRPVIWMKRLGRCFLVGGLVAATALFVWELSLVGELRIRCDRVEEEAIRYENLVMEGDAACGKGDMRQGERCYLTALQINGAKPDPYVKLAQIYREYRCYDLALEILEEYSGEDEEIRILAKEIRDEIAELEVSVFQEMGK